MGGPPSGGFPQQGYPQQPGGFPPYGHPQQGGYPGQTGPYGQPPKKKTGLIIGLAGGGVALVAVVVILIVVFAGGNDPRSVAEDFASGVTNQDADAVRGSFCDVSDFDDSEFTDLDSPPPDAPADFKAEVRVTGDANETSGEAIVPISMSVSGGGMSQELTGELVLKDNDGWCIDDFRADTPEVPDTPDMPSVPDMPDGYPSVPDLPDYESEYGGY
ncbi:hypothetical protein BJF85_08125 [Saccharomonospora sp. CUA-673]|nr:hypothetical protein BJF85_08125 [Saccharomonospora sp. CUA-673]